MVLFLTPSVAELELNTPMVRAVCILLLAVAAAVTAHLWRPTKLLTDQIGKPDLEAIFPKAFGDWRTDDRMPVVLPSPDVQAKLNAIYNQVLSRTFVNSQGERMMLSVAYGGDQSDGTKAHRPEVCYPVQGFQMVSSAATTISLNATRGLHVRQLMAKQGSREEPITYWVVVGDKVATSSTEQKLAQLRFGVRGYIPDGMLVRVSSIDKDAKRAHALQQQFIAELMQATAPAAQPRIFGA